FRLKTQQSYDTIQNKDKANREGIVVPVTTNFYRQTHNDSDVLTATKTYFCILLASESVGDTEFLKC
ncbi:hypothetical protein SEEH3101_24605, partial [Salmonella enterica subsp. enterica serovar Heidelberg str. 607310-1]